MRLLLGELLAVRKKSYLRQAFYVFLFFFFNARPRQQFILVRIKAWREYSGIDAKPNFHFHG